MGDINCVIYRETPLVPIPEYLVFTGFCGVGDFPVVEVVYGVMEWDGLVGSSWSSPELWNCLLYTPNFQHTLNFISHRGLGWAGAGIKSSSQDQPLKAAHKSLRGQRQESDVGISLQP